MNIIDKIYLPESDENVICIFFFSLPYETHQNCINNVEKTVLDDSKRCLLLSIKNFQLAYFWESGFSISIEGNKSAKFFFNPNKTAFQISEILELTKRLQNSTCKVALFYANLLQNLNEAK